MSPVTPIIARLSSSLVWLNALYCEAAAILMLSSIPSVGEGVNGGPAAHLLAYTAVSFTAGVLLLIRRSPLAILKGALIAAMFGCCVELLQHFIPYRSCELADAAVNCAASLIGMIAAGSVQLFFFRPSPLNT